MEEPPLHGVLVDGEPPCPSGPPPLLGEHNVETGEDR